MDNTNGLITPSTNYTQTQNKKSPLGKVLYLIGLLALIGAIVALVFLLRAEQEKVAKFALAAEKTKELVNIVNSDVYDQFKKVDERGHFISTETCGEIVASNDYKETKPEYVKFVKNGICDPHSNVYKPNYGAFTPKLQEKSQEINGIYSQLGIGTVGDFKDKDTKNYLNDTCSQLIDVGTC